ncbi:MAG: hypothetical protein NUV98_05140 [Candidatus Roizmanbacteria bacterium]|nr:hypothetical protein [Candidatus Roizmanbacteria bacterium]
MNVIQDKTIASIVIAVSILIGVFAVVQKVDQYLRIKAVNDCQTTAQVSEVVGETKTYTYPMQDLYETCMAEKGY